VGIFSAALAYLSYTVAVVLLAGLVGSQLGVGIMTILVGLLIGIAVVGLGRITLDSLRSGDVGAILRDNWLWGLLFLAVAAIGFSFQWRTTQSFVVKECLMGTPLESMGMGKTTNVAARF
jgi:hypothetical protein